MKTRVTIFNYTDVQQNVFKFSPSDKNVSNEELQVFEALMFLCNDMLTNIFYVTTHGMVTRQNSSPSIMENMLKVAPSIDDVMSSCEWRSKSVECSKLFKTVLTAQGVCFTMNVIQAQEMFSKDNVWSNYNFSNVTLNETRRGWTTNGYYDSNEKDPYPRRGRGDGAKPELVITFTETQIDHDQVCNSLNNGFKVYIQHPDDMPGSSTHYYVIAPEKQTELFLKFNMLSTAEKLRVISSETRQCYFPEEHPLRYFKIYTASNCHMECLANITHERCKCVGFHMPRENNTKICTFLHSLCMDSAQETLAEKQAKYSYIHTETEEKHETCNCLPSCNTVDYDADIIASDFNRKAYLRSLSALLEYDKIYNLTKSKTYSVMRMYYKQPRYVSMRRSELFGITDFLANCGGLLGLFLGFSFLSLVEIIYFITFRLWCTIKRNAKEEITTQN